MEIINRQAQKVVAVAYRRWSFTGGSTVRLRLGNVGVLDWRSLIGGGRLQEVVYMEVSLKIISALVYASPFAAKKATSGQISLVLHRQYAVSVFKRSELN